MKKYNKKLIYCDKNITAINQSYVGCCFIRCNLNLQYCEFINCEFINCVGYTINECNFIDCQHDTSVNLPSIVLSNNTLDALFI